MNYKELFSGGETPMSLKEFTRLDDSTREALFFLVSGLTGGDNCIISGCVPTVDGVTGAVTVTAGYVLLDNEIIEVEAQTVEDGLGTGLFEYQKTTSYDSEGTKTFVDQVQRQTWRKDRAVLANVAVVATLAYDGQRLQASEETTGVAKIATQAITDEGENDTDIVTPKKLGERLSRYQDSTGAATTTLTSSLQTFLTVNIDSEMPLPIITVSFQLRISDVASGGDVIFIIKVNGTEIKAMPTVRMAWVDTHTAQTSYSYSYLSPDGLSNGDVVTIQGSSSSDVDTAEVTQAVLICH